MPAFNWDCGYQHLTGTAGAPARIITGTAGAPARIITGTAGAPARIIPLYIKSS